MTTATRARRRKPAPLNLDVASLPSCWCGQSRLAKLRASQAERATLPALCLDCPLSLRRGGVCPLFGIEIGGAGAESVGLGDSREPTVAARAWGVVVRFGAAVGTAIRAAMTAKAGPKRKRRRRTRRIG